MGRLPPGPIHSKEEGLNYLICLLFSAISTGKDRAMKNELTREMVLQTMVALLSMGLAVLSLMFMGRWV